MGPLRVSGPFNFTAICYTSGHLPFGRTQIPRPCRENLHPANFRLLGGVPRTSAGPRDLGFRAHLDGFRVPPEPTELLLAPRRAQNAIFGSPKSENLVPEALKLDLDSVEIASAELNSAEIESLNSHPLNSSPLSSSPLNSSQLRSNPSHSIPLNASQLNSSPLNSGPLRSSP